MSGLEVRGLTKRFKAETALEDVSLSVAQGETLALFGPSGAGKTVLLRCLAGAVDPTEGSILIAGEDVTDTPPESRGIGMAFQNFALFPHMSAFDNIASPLTARRSTKAAISEGVEKVARLLKIDHVLGHAPKALSNGQKQRTALARALAAAPDILLLDDPLRNVDAKLRFEMRLELPRLLADQGATVIYVTQDYREAMALGDRIAVLDAGRVVQIGTPEDIYHRPADTQIARLFGDPTINLLNVTPERDARGVFAVVSGRRLALGSGLDEAVGARCVLGLRPETLRFSDEPAAIPIVIEAETPLNEKTVTLAVTAGGRELLISRPAGTPAPAEGAAGVTVDPARALLFDEASGALIAAATTSAANKGAAA